MAESDDSSKTEQPSQRKLTKARSEGQVIQSREINSLFMLSVGAAIVLLFAPSVAGRMEVTLARFLDPASLIGGGGVLWEAVAALLVELAKACVLPLVLLVAVAIAGSVMQTGLVLATEKLGFDISRVSPLAGLKRLFSLRAVLEFIKNLAKVAAVMGVAGWFLAPELLRVPAMISLDAGALGAEIQHALLHLSLGILGLIVVLALVDYAYQRFSFMREMRMSKQEVKEENKQSEGDPMVKARLRQIRMDRARRRMMAAVPTASVVVTNPTHYAVALKYQMGAKGAPRVVAKGADLIAQRIREIARENDVPLVENPPLARALYATVDLDHEIPPEHYRAVAEIISYVFRLKEKARPR
ncbi:MAG TPA: flagellar biosynthesis protein FlhB [Stellaceae bacterium]|nr:flagellar biosynthesis protein FlhB [Stellaceae bacterium]